MASCRRRRPGCSASSTTRSPDPLAADTEARLALVGFGNVGQALARLLLRKRESAPAWRAVAIATGSHGMAQDPDGLDLEQALILAAAGADLSELGRQPAASETMALIESCG